MALIWSNPSAHVNTGSFSLLGLVQDKKETGRREDGPRGTDTELSTPPPPCPLPGAEDKTGKGIELKHTNTSGCFKCG